MRHRLRTLALLPLAGFCITLAACSADSPTESSRAPLARPAATGGSAPSDSSSASFTCLCEDGTIGSMGSGGRCICP